MFRVNISSIVRGPQTPLTGGVFEALGEKLVSDAVIPILHTVWRPRGYVWRSLTTLHISNPLVHPCD